MIENTGVPPKSLNIYFPAIREPLKTYDHIGGDKLIKGSLINTDNNSLNKEQTNKVKKDRDGLNSADYTKLAEKLKSFLGEDNVAIEFALDKETKKMVMKIINSETKEIVQQFPPEITLKLARIAANSLEGGQIANAKV